MSKSRSKMSDKSASENCRTRPRVNERAEVDAPLHGQLIIDSAEIAVEEEAKTVLADNEPIVLSKQASNEFLTAISGEPETPSPQLLGAVAVYKQHQPVRPR